MWTSEPRRHRTRRHRHDDGSGCGTAVARTAADDIRSRPYLELVREPDLSVVAFRRLGWSAADYDAWSNGLLETQVAFVLPTVHAGGTITRFAIVNPRTTPADISAILDTMS